MCSAFRQVTERKHVWLTIFLRDICYDLVPPYCQAMDMLSAHAVEVLVLHSLRVQQAMDSGPASVTIRPFHQPRSITWVRILHGTWLLVAASDSVTSTLSLWSAPALLSSSRKRVAPAAEVYLNGPVHSGEVYISENQITLALDIRALSCVLLVSALVVKTDLHPNVVHAGSKS